MFNKSKKSNKIVASKKKSKLTRSIKGKSTNRIEQSNQCDMSHYVAKSTNLKN